MEQRFVVGCLDGTQAKLMNGKTFVCNAIADNYYGCTSNMEKYSVCVNAFSYSYIYALLFA